MNGSVVPLTGWGRSHPTFDVGPVGIGGRTENSCAFVGWLFERRADEGSLRIHLSVHCHRGLPHRHGAGDLPGKRSGIASLGARGSGAPGSRREQRSSSDRFELLRSTTNSSPSPAIAATRADTRTAASPREQRKKSAPMPPTNSVLPVCVGPGVVETWADFGSAQPTFRRRRFPSLLQSRKTRAEAYSSMTLTVRAELHELSGSPRST